MNRFAIRAVVLSLVAGFVATPLRADTWVVDDDGGPGVDFTDVQAAIDAAQPGDQILMHAGIYADCVITKGVSLVGLPGELVQFDGLTHARITIRDIPADQGVTLSGLQIARVEVFDCVGPVVLDQLFSEYGYFLHPSVGVYIVLAPVHAESVELLTLTRCELYGGQSLSPNPYTDWSEALTAVDSTVIVSQCELEGGDGGAEDNTVWSDGEPGGPAVHAVSSKLIVQSSLVTGGHGGNAYTEDFFGSGDGGAGAPAFKLESSSSLDLFGTAEHETTGGRGGLDGPGHSHAPGGPAIEVLSGSAVRHSGVSLSTFEGAPLFAGPGSVSEVAPIPVLTLSGGLMGATADITLHGPQGAVFLVWAALSAQVLPLNGYTSVFLLDGPPLLKVGQGSLGAGGTWLQSVAIPVAPEFAGLPIHLQAGLQQAPFGKALSTSTSFVLR